MIIENTQQLDELLSFMRRAAGGAKPRAKSPVGGAGSRVNRAANRLSTAILAPGTKRRAAEGGRRPGRKIRVAIGSLSKALRGKKTGYDVNVAKRLSARMSDRTSVVKPEHRARVSAAADRVIKKRKAAGKTTTHRQAYNMYKKAGDTARMSQVKRAYVKAHAKRNLTRDMGSGSGNRARRRSHAVARATMPGRLGIKVRQRRPAGGMNTAANNPNRLFASWNPTFDKLINEVSPPGFEGTVKAMKKHDEIDNPYALSWYMKNKGYKSHKKKDGTDKK